MSVSAFFIDRPVFAWVVTLLICLAAIVALPRLPIELYPQIAPPEIAITARYPGATAELMEKSVTQIIEQQLTGIDDLNYITSSSDQAGQAQLTLTFHSGANLDAALMQVQNKLQLASGRLPEEVIRQGISIDKAARNFILIPCFYSPDNSLSSGEIADYVASNIQDAVGRTPGVASTILYGSPYAIRIWLNPFLCEKYGVTPQDISNAVKNQNAQISAGQIGGLPAASGQEINMAIQVGKRLESVEEFENIIIRVGEDASPLRLKDVARIELASENFNDHVMFNGKPAAGMGIGLAPGANALRTAELVKKELASLARFFPTGMEMQYSYDGSPFVKDSIFEVLKTLVEAIFLVCVIIYIFLQSWRTMLIPAITVPIILLGTAGIMLLADYSVNIITMFAMVLAIGLIVDDAIVVTENAARVLDDSNVSPKKAIKRSMRQISGALVGITIVLISVFCPMLFLQGSAGALYQQFGITLISALALSLFVAIVLSPSMCALFLRKIDSSRQNKFFRQFNHIFDALANFCQKSVSVCLDHKNSLAALFAVLTIACGIMAWLLPSAFLPAEDQSRMFVSVRMPSGASMERTLQVMREVENYFLVEEKDSIENLLTVVGRSFNVTGQNTGTVFIKLKVLGQRRNTSQKVDAIKERCTSKFAKLPQGQVFAFSPPPVPELGNAAGFDFMLIDRGGLGHEKLMQARNTLLAKAAGQKELGNLRPAGLNDVALYKLDIDLAKAGFLGVTPDEINEGIGGYWGSIYINDFFDRGRSKRVYLQSDIPFRMQPDDFGKYFARNKAGEMVSFSEFIDGGFTQASPRIEHYNGLPALEILGEAASGHSTGDAMRVMEDLAEQLPTGLDYAWTGISLQEKDSTGNTLILLCLSICVVFLCLAALYESWRLPVVVMLAAPLGAFGSLAAAWLAGLNNDIYFQLGLLTIIGLATRNAVFIVEFAKDSVNMGMTARDAVLNAVKMRLRPIFITSLTFLGGILPLAFSGGTNAGAQNSLGIALMGGIIMSTICVLYFTPLFFILLVKEASGCDIIYEHQ